MSNVISFTELKSIATENEKKTDERGLFFRCRRSAWTNSKGDINFRYEFRFLKSKSGSGEHVDWLWDEFQTRVDDYNFWGDYGVEFEDAVDGQLYEFKVVATSTDWESGVVEDFTLGFVQVDEEK